MNYEGIGDPVGVQIPSACFDLEAGIFPYPVPEDARDFSVLPGFFSFLTGLSLEEVDDFYQEALPPLGWVPVDAQIDEVEGTIVYENEFGETLKLSIAPDPETGVSTVILSMP